MSSERCYSCSVKFSVFKKGKSCQQCGLVFCDKCVSPQPDLNLTAVCQHCADTLRGKKDQRSPPAKFVERLQQQQQSNPPSYTAATSAEGPRKSSNAPSDQEIQERLKRLSGNKLQSAPSVDELHSRLQKLKQPTIDLTADGALDGEASASGPGATSSSGAVAGASAAVQFEPDPVKTPDDLILQMRQKLALEGKIVGGEDQRMEDSADADSDESEDDDVKTQKLIAKILAEQEFEAQYGALNNPPSNLPGQPVPEEDPELPWCVICNSDEILVRCLNCDRELYCLRCFNEAHDEPDLASHVKMAFRPK